jgi:hypothetical protein
MSRYPQDDLSATVGDWIMNTVRRNPEGLLVLAAGCALLVRGGGAKASGFSTKIDGAYGEATGRVSGGTPRSGVADRASDAANYVSDVKDRVADTASSYANSVYDYASDAAQNLSDQSLRLKQQAQSSLQSGMERMLREQPLAVAILGVAAGAAVAAVLPTTGVENQAFGGAREALADAANKVGENVMGAAGAAGERLKNVATERGFTPDGLKEVARDVANTFTTKVTGNGTDQASGTSQGKDAVVEVAGSSPSLVPNRTRSSDRGDR